MRAEVLVSKIIRALETDCSFSDGVALATEYNEAVDALNNRLDAILAAIDGGEVSDAIRLMDEKPRALDFGNTLFFARLEAWRAFCVDHGYAEPKALNQTGLDRLVQFNDGADAVDGALKLYRRASRMGDDKMMLQSLRHLVNKDTSQDWTSKLGDVERVYVKRLLEEYEETLANGDEERGLEIALEVGETAWVYAPTGRTVEKINSLLRAREEARMKKEAEENMRLLKGCVDDWRRPRAEAMIAAMDALVAQGFSLSFEDRELIGMLRDKAQKEVEAIRAEEEWKRRCEELHAAIEVDDARLVRGALASPEFFEREPPKDLLEGAQDVIAREEKIKKRRLLRRTAGAVVTVALALGASGIWFKHKVFMERCAAEVTKLEMLKNGAYAIDRLSEALVRLKTEDAAVYERPEIAVYEKTLQSMREQNVKRTNEVVRALGELTKMKSDGWSEDDLMSVTSKLAVVERLLTKEDVRYRAMWEELKLAWNEFTTEESQRKEDAAEASYEKLFASIRALVKAYTSRLVTAKTREKLETCKRAIEVWKRERSELVPENNLAELERQLAEAQARQKDYRDVIAKLNAAEKAVDIVAARKTLVDAYGAFEEVKALGAYPWSVEDVKRVLDGMTPRQKTDKDSAKVGVDDKMFKTFLEEEVSQLKELPAYYNLYGVEFADGKGKTWLAAISKGKPVREHNGNITSDGMMLIAKGAESYMSNDLEVKKSKLPPQIYEMELTAETKEIVDTASYGDVTQAKFKSLLLKWMKVHFDSANKASSDSAGNERKWRKFYPSYRRVWMMNIYIGWLKQLNLYPKGLFFDGVAREVGELAAPITIGDVHEDMASLCVWDIRVQARNRRAKDFLERKGGRWKTELGVASEEMRILREIADFKVVDAGKLKFPIFENEPSDEGVKKLVVDEASDVKKEAPLYVLRQDENGEFILKKALVARQDKVSGRSKWHCLMGMKKELVTGEPLFQVAIGTKRIDARQTLEEGLKKKSLTEEKKQAILKTCFYQ